MSQSQPHRPLYETKAGFFKGLAHPIRIRALEYLCDGHEHSVTALQQHTGLEASHLSSHLAVLRRHQVVTSERRGSHVYYRVTSPEVSKLLESARRFLTEVLQTRQDELAGMHELPDLPR